jgi:hypothetical protein
MPPAHLFQMLSGFDHDHLFISLIFFYFSPLALAELCSCISTTPAPLPHQVRPTPFPVLLFLSKRSRCMTPARAFTFVTQACSSGRTYFVLLSRPSAVFVTTSSRHHVLAFSSCIQPKRYERMAHFLCCRFLACSPAAALLGEGGWPQLQLARGFWGESGEKNR